MIKIQTGRQHSQQSRSESVGEPTKNSTLTEQRNVANDALDIFLNSHFLLFVYIFVSTIGKAN